MDENGGQAEAGSALFDDFATRGRVGVKARAHPCELRLESVAGDETHPGVLEDRSCRFPGGIVGPVGRWAEEGSPGRVPDPVVDDREHYAGHDHLDHKGDPVAEQPRGEGLDPPWHAEQPRVGKSCQKR